MRVTITVSVIFILVIFAGCSEARKAPTTSVRKLWRKNNAAEKVGKLTRQWYEREQTNARIREQIQRNDELIKRNDQEIMDLKRTNKQLREEDDKKRTDIQTLTNTGLTLFERTWKLKMDQEKRMETDIDLRRQIHTNKASIQRCKDTLKTKIDTQEAKVDALKELVAFTVQTPHQFGFTDPAHGKTITYNNVVVDVGGAIDPNTGQFTAPCRGLFMFTVDQREDYASENNIPYCLTLNRGIIIETCVHNEEDISSPVNILLDLDKGDTVSVVVADLEESLDYDDIVIAIFRFTGTQITSCH